MAGVTGVQQVLASCRNLLNSCKEITVKVPWGFVKGIEVGPRDGAPVVMVHGWLDNCYSFVPLLTALPPTRRYIALDLPGHGHSSHKPKSSYNFILGSVVDMEAIRRSLGLEKFTLVGHSMGGTITTLYAATYPDKIERSVALDSIIPYLGDGDVAGQLRVAADQHLDDSFRHKIYPSAERLAQIKSESTWYQGLSPEYCQLIGERGSAPVEEGGVKQLYSGNMRYKSLLYLSKEQYLSLIRSLSRPHLYIEGREGCLSFLPAAVRDACDFVVAANSVIRKEVIPGPHHVHITSAVETAAVIERFLSETPPTSNGE